jgi:hypothetical protein
VSDGVSGVTMPTARERGYERLLVAALGMQQSLGVLKGWQDDFGSESVTTAVWEAHDKLRDALKALPPARAALDSEVDANE